MNDLVAAERSRAIAWKSSTRTLLVEAPVAGPVRRQGRVTRQDGVRFCRPAEHAELTLLPEVREPVLALFAELEIQWHAGLRPPTIR